MISFTSEQLAQWYGALFWPLVRVMALISVAPLLSHRAVPARLKIGLGVGITAVILPQVQSPAITDVLSAAGLMMLVHNILVGVLIGFTIRMVFASLELAGELVGLQMGLSFAAFFNPASDQTQNAVASFLSLIALLTFLSIDGHLMLIHALSESFRLFPIAVDAAALPLTLERAVGLAADMFSVALTLALPFLAVMLLINIVLGVLARVAPQLNIFAVGFPMTILVGLVTLMLLLPYLEVPLRSVLERALTAWTR
jgi:flagellar biosynthesis protein FliR